MSNEILAQAKKYLNNPDLIIDSYDTTIIWASKNAAKITGYSVNELGSMTAMSLLSMKEKIKQFFKIVTILKQSGKTLISIKTKQGKIVKIETEFYNFEFNEGFFHASKIIRKL